MTDTPETRYAKSGDAHIAYQIVGEGALDIVLTSYGNISVDAFDREPNLSRFLKRLGKFARIIRFDRRGVGMSDPISVDSPPTLEQGVADTVAVLEATGSKHVALFDTFGSSAFQVLAATRPDVAGALVLCNTWARMEWAPDYPWGYPTEFLDSFSSRVVEQDFDEMQGSETVILAPSLAHDEQFRRWWAEEGRRGASPATAKMINLFNAHSDARDALPSIGIPTLVLHSRDNLWAPIAHGRYLAERISNAKFVELEGQDQYIFGELADQVLEEVAEFLTGERHQREADRVLATILLTDIVGSTEHLARIGDSMWRELLDRHDAMVRRQIERFEGHEVNTTGDGILVTFTGPARAVQCALAIRDGAGQLGIDIRAGLHTGEVERRGDDISGIAVHLAQRISALAASGRVLTSSTVKDLAFGSGLAFADMGPHEFKGVPGTWHIYEATT